MRYIIICPLCIAIFFLIGCEKIEFADGVNLSRTGLIDAPSVNSMDVLERAYQMATVEWIPLGAVPKLGGGYYEPGEKIKGVPYSSVKEINTYLFQDVSYHTFMTSIHNPRSVMYTENISEEPYHGENCAPYYGSVCSSSIMWALGISIPYSTNLIIEQPFLKRLDSQIIDSLKVCDILWKEGHVQMVYDTEFQSDTLYKIRMFEQSGKRAHISSYSKSDFRKIWEKEHYVAYRYKYVTYTKRPKSFKTFPPVDYNDDLCPSKGDRSVYRTDDNITIDIFSRDYDLIVLEKDGEVLSSDKYQGEEYQYEQLSPGVYYVYLQSGDRKTSPISFEVVDVEVNFKRGNSRKEILIYFSSSAVADYAVLCTQDGSSLFFPITDIDRGRGYISVPVWNNPKYYCKVVFKGEYGSVINKPIRVR